MSNAVAHKVETVDFLTVETANQLRSALTHLIGDGDENLDRSYVVSLLSETLSDGSRAYELNIRKAERIA